jgi:hypothetical protein
VNFRTIEVVSGALRVLTATHTLPCDGHEVRCSTWRTDGLAALKHPELTLTLRRAPDESDEAISLDVLRFFIGMYSRAQQGESLAAGMTGEFPAGLFEASEPYGVAFVRTLPVEGLDLAPRGITAVVLHRDELLLARTFGVRRVLARMARHARCAPFPLWWDSKRTSVVHSDEAVSVLAPIDRMPLVHSVAALRDKTVTVTLARAHASALAATLATRGALPYAIYTEPPPDADAFFVWNPGQTSLSAATIQHAKGACIAGNFVLFRPGAISNRVSMIEDGFAIDLTHEGWDEWQRAVAECRSFEIPAGENTRGLVVSWEDPSRDVEPAHFERAEVMTETDPQRAGLDAPTLTRYARALRDVIERHFFHSWQPTGQDLLLHVEMHPNRAPNTDIALRPGPPPRVLNGLHAAMTAVEAPAVTNPVVFRVFYSLWGGSKVPL